MTENITKPPRAPSELDAESLLPREFKDERRNRHIGNALAGVVFEQRAYFEVENRPLSLDGTPFIIILCR